MSDIVDAFFNMPIPERVWHYTTIAALEGILSSGTVWATEAHYTTDASEFIHARAIATAFLEGISPSDEIAARAKKAALTNLEHAFDRGALSPETTEVFVASFSSSVDLKSQWMEYAHGGTGLSIAFDLREIRPPKELQYAVTFAPCLYVQEDKEALLIAAMGDFIETFVNLYQATGNKQWVAEQMVTWTIDHGIFVRADFEASLNRFMRTRLHSALTYTSFDMLRAASHCKDYAFHQECEWRLALPHSKSKPFTGIQIQYRGAQKNIPYVAHNLFRDKLPITQIVAGPLCQDIARIQELLDLYGYQVPLTRSQVALG